MAYSKTPTMDTYSTERISFVVNPHRREVSVETGVLDAYMYNMAASYTANAAGERTYFAKTRPCMNGGLSWTVSGVREDRGVFIWDKYNDAVISVYGNTVYANSTALITLTTSTGRVGFTQYMDDTGAEKLILLDGTKGYVLSDLSTYVEITDVDFPTPHIPFPIFLGGYLFVAKANSNDIYNSDLNAPTVWQAGNFISAEGNSDYLRGLARIGDYIVAIGSQSVEYFYNAGNATGTPLAKHNSAGFDFGTQQPETISTSENELIFLSWTRSGEIVLRLIDGFQDQVLHIPTVAKQVHNPSASATDTAKHAGYFMRAGGHRYYVLVPYNSVIAVVYDLDLKVWTYWQTSFLNPSTQYIAWPRRASSGSNGAMHLQFPSDATRNKGFVATLGTQSGTDSAFGETSNITQEVRTPELDFGNMNIKTMFKASVVGEGGTSDSTNISLSWSDNYNRDYTSPVNVIMDKANPLRSPALHQLGAFRRRSFKVTHNEGQFLRLYGLEMDINKGVR